MCERSTGRVNIHYTLTSQHFSFSSGAWWGGSLLTQAREGESSSKALKMNFPEVRRWAHCPLASIVLHVPPLEKSLPVLWNLTSFSVGHLVVAEVILDNELNYICKGGFSEPSFKYQHSQFSGTGMLTYLWGEKMYHQTHNSVICQALFQVLNICFLIFGFQRPVVRSSRFIWNPSLLFQFTL